MNILNKESFDCLSKAKKRVAIAQDVIQRIDANKILPNNGNFFNNRCDLDHKKDPKESFNTQTCEVCAKGALMVSWVGNFDNASWRDIEEFGEEIGDMSYPLELLDIFGRKMLDNIEAAFESKTYIWHYDENVTFDYAEQFKEYDLRGIMQYIVDHKGNFPLLKNPA